MRRTLTWLAQTPARLYGVLGGTLVLVLAAVVVVGGLRLQSVTDSVAAATEQRRGADSASELLLGDSTLPSQAPLPAQDALPGQAALPSQEPVPSVEVSLPAQVLEVGPSVASSTPVEEPVDERERVATELIAAWAAGTSVDGLAMPALLDALGTPPEGLAVSGPATLSAGGPTLAVVDVPTTEGVAVATLRSSGDVWLVEEVLL